MKIPKKIGGGGGGRVGEAGQGRCERRSEVFVKKKIGGGGGGRVGVGLGGVGIDVYGEVKFFFWMGGRVGWGGASGWGG